jgi:hypothetical protein
MEQLKYSIPADIDDPKSELHEWARREYRQMEKSEASLRDVRDEVGRLKSRFEEAMYVIEGGMRRPILARSDRLSRVLRDIQESAGRLLAKMEGEAAP